MLETSNQYWPLNSKGELDPEIFDENFIKDVFYKHIPNYYSCTQNTVRKGLQNIYKKNALSKKANTYNNEIAVNVCSKYKLRLQLPNLKIKYEKKNNFSNGPPKVKKLNRELSQLFWLFYDNSEYPDIPLWAERVADQEIKTFKRHFITATSLSENFKISECPIEFDSLDMARVITIYAGLLDKRSEKIQLIETAISLGNSYLKEPLEENKIEEDDQKNLEYETLKEISDKTKYFPRFKERKELSLLQKELKKNVSEIEKFPSIDKILDLSTKSFESELGKLALIHKNKARLKDDISKEEKFIKSKLKCWTGFRNIETKVLENRITTNPTELISACIQNEEAIFLFDELSARNITSFFQEDSSNISNLAELKAKLIELISNAMSVETFVKGIKPYLSKKDLGNTEKLEILLQNLQYDEKKAILSSLQQRSFMPFAAFLWAHLQQEAEDPSSLSRFNFSMANPFDTRGIFYFVNIEDLDLNNDIRATQNLFIEVLKDVLVFGHTEKLKKFCERVKNKNIIFGDKIVSLINFIKEHEIAFSEGSVWFGFLIKKISPISFQEHSEKYKTQTYGTNIFAKIEETAAEANLKPLLNSSPDFNIDKIHNKKDLIYKLMDGLSIFEFGKYWNQKYKLFLSQVVEKFLYFQEPKFLEEINTLSNFESIATEFEKLFSKLSDGGDQGSLNQFEAKIKKSFLNGIFEVPHPTLTGSSENIVERLCGQNDLLFSLNYSDCPILYYEDDVFLIESIAQNFEEFLQSKKVDPRQVVSDLNEKKQYAHALFLSELISGPDEKLVKETKLKAEKEMTSAAKNFASIEDDLTAAIGSESDDYNNLSIAMERLEFEYVHDKILSLSIEHGIGKAGVQNTDDADRVEKTRIRNFLLELEYPVENESYDDLLLIWEEELRLRAGNRLHLIEVYSAIKKYTTIDDLPEKLLLKLNHFAENVEDPVYWLNESLSQDLTDSLSLPSKKIETWLNNYVHFTPEIKLSVEHLTIWFVNFVQAKSKSLSKLVEGELYEDLIDPILEACIIFEENNNPSICLEIIREEFSFYLEDIKDEEMVDGFEGSSKDFVPSNIEREIEGETVNNSIIKEAQYREVEISNFSNLPNELKQLVKNKNWSLAIDFANEQSLSKICVCLRSIESLLSDNSVGSENLDQTTTVAEILFGPVGLSNILLENDLTLIVFNILSKIYLGSSYDKKKTIRAHDEEIWKNLFSSNSLFLDIDLNKNIMDEYRQILNLVFNSHFGREYGLKIWQASKKFKTTDCQVNFLRLLYTINSTDIILTLCRKHEPKIRDELEDLFRARLSSNDDKMAPIIHAYTSRVLSKASKSGSFSQFLKTLSLFVEEKEPEFNLNVEDQLVIHREKGNTSEHKIPIEVSISNLILESVEVSLSKEDDVYFVEDGRQPSTRQVLTKDHIYSSKSFFVNIKLGESWNSKGGTTTNNFQLGLKGIDLETKSVYTSNKYCSVSFRDRSSGSSKQITEETIPEIYHGINNNVVPSEYFYGRIDEIERLRSILVKRENPSPVILTGMRRVGKSSLLHQFHRSQSDLDRGNAVTVYLSLAEKGSHFADGEDTVSKVFWDSIKRVFTKNLIKKDHNYKLVSKLEETAKTQSLDYKNLVKNCYDPESLMDTLIQFSEVILELLGSTHNRVILLIDEAEQLVRAFNAGSKKKNQLATLFQSLREVNQGTNSLGILLSGSHHINVFADDYQYAFFGSCEKIKLGGILEYDQAKHLIAPNSINAYIKFDENAIRYAIDICAGLPLWMWYVGAITSFNVRGGTATISDIKRAIEVLVSGKNTNYFSIISPLHPLEFEINLEPRKEAHYLWILLFKIAAASATVDRSANKLSIIDKELLALDTEQEWMDRLSRLLELKFIIPTEKSFYKFAVPLFAEAFRAPHKINDFRIKVQRVS